MTPRFKQKPIIATDYAPPQKIRRTPASMIADIKRMLLAGSSHAEIKEALGATKYLIWRTGRELHMPAQNKQRGTGLFPSPAKNPHRCSGSENCDCVTCGANRIKTPEWHRETHAMDEWDRLERHRLAQEAKANAKTTQEPSEARNDAASKLGALNAMSVSPRQQP